MTYGPYMHFDGHITAVVGGPRATARDITYDAVFYGPDRNGTISGFTPSNRRYSTAEMIAAKVNDPVHVRVSRATGETQVYLYTERDALRDCDGNPVEPDDL